MTTPRRCSSIGSTLTTAVAAGYAGTITMGVHV